MSKLSPFSALNTEQQAAAKAIAEMLSGRRPRNVVTPKGRGARGHFPSRKAPKHLKYESLIEQDVLRVLEIATLPKVLGTQPCVLNLRCDLKAFRYTPDVEVTTDTDRFFVEVKDESALSDEDGVLELRRIIRGMREGGLLLVPILSSDVREGGLQAELEILIRERPAPGRYRDGIDASLWDPLGEIRPSKGLSERWFEAKRTCDELLQRVMRRDPDDLLPAINR